MYCFGASLVAQLIKNPPAIQDIRVRSLDWEDPLKKRMATHSSNLAWRIQSTGLQKSDTTKRLSFHFTDCFTLCSVLEIYPCCC